MVPASTPEIALPRPAGDAKALPRNSATAPRQAINAHWLCKLRWVAIVGQLITVAVVALFLEVTLPLRPLLGLIVFTAGTNLAFWLWLRQQDAVVQEAAPRSWHPVLGSLMLLDLLALSLMLTLTGGATNPFAIFYFVNLALCGVLLPPRWAWLLCAMAVVAFGLISWMHLPLPALQDPHRLLSIQQQGGIKQLGAPRLAQSQVVQLGAWAAFAACSGVVVSFTTRLTGELRRSQEARLRAEELRSRSEKLEALGTLAAGAAHELATPLSTIAVVARELERELDGCEVTADVAADVQLIRRELDRCRAILDRMSMEAGQAAGEAPGVATIADLTEMILAELPDRDRVSTNLNDAVDAAVRAPMTALTQALRALLQNALDASPEDEAGSQILWETSLQKAEHSEPPKVMLTIQDQGTGMSRTVLSRAGDPFFTTKEPGQGMGLGLFLARSVVERIGGQLTLNSTLDQGTTVRVSLPVTLPEDAKEVAPNT